MKIKKISYEMLFNMGEYQNEKIGFTAELEDSDTPEKSFLLLKEKIEDAHIYSKRVQDAERMIKQLQGSNNYEFTPNIPLLEAEIQVLNSTIYKTHITDINEISRLKQIKEQKVELQKGIDTLSKIKEEKLRLRSEYEN